MNKRQIDYKFAANWKSFINWYKTFTSKSGVVPMWDIQTQKIEMCFSKQAAGVVNWRILWDDFKLWRDALKTKRGGDDPNWDEQRRQIETIMLNQAKDLNSEQFVLVYLHKGKPSMDTNKMTYWEAVRTKEMLEGDSNGRGGNEDMDKVSIVNLAHLLQ